MSTTPNPSGARERDVFMAMLARLDAELDRDLASSKKPVPGAEPQTDFVPTLQLLKEDEMAELAAQPRPQGTRRAAPAARPQRTRVARLLPWLVGGGLAASAASFAVTFSGSRPPAVPAPITAAVAAPVPAAVPVPVPATVAPAPAPVAPAPVPTPVAESPAPAPVVVAAAETRAPAEPAASGTTCPPARRALGLCDVQAP